VPHRLHLAVGDGHPFFIHGFLSQESL
jgi:hypothetical protein